KAVDIQARRILKLFGKDVKRVIPVAGAEQEYFLISRDYYNQRRDLMYTGRTLFGATPPKSQQLDDHYSGHIRIHAANFMKELDEELWKLGILAKTEHNEVAPAQHELAPIFTVVNLSCDQNQLVMETMRKVAKRQNLACLLHEKPFAGINGSGKHNNWSLMTDTGEKLFDPGTTPEANAQFLLFLCAVIKAVDEYQDVLRISTATSTNDRRLGAAEAPPAVVSMFLGDELEAILDSIEKGVTYDKKDRGVIQIGVDTLPSFQRDATDRNRTSPFAFTSNRFEFRMPGSSLSISGPNTVINTIVAESLRVFADELEGAEDLTGALNALIKRTISRHRRIIFNGNGYDDEWVREAERRGLSNYRTAAEAIPHMLDEKNVELFTRHGVYSERELAARCQINLGTYCRTMGIEAATMLEMTRRDILPAVFRYEKALSDGVVSKKAAGEPSKAEKSLLTRISALSDSLNDKADGLEALIARTKEMETLKLANFYSTKVIPAMDALRADADALEELTDEKEWPFPTYGKLLYRV
ncbi:MAG: glutamine synthetase type III, partial [Oscillospiraceae bacterium]|nr:glutamine synthetase type III [Oscillospiraceae bacterium]